MKNHMLVLAQEYLAYRRKLGFKLEVEGQQILNFARYADKVGHKGPLTTDLALRWARLPMKGSRLYQARRLEVVRCFAKYLVIFEPHTEIPGKRLLGAAHRRTQPHIYSSTEIQLLLKEARVLSPAHGLRPRTYTTLIGLLASTGLRPSEALKLSREDANLRDGVLTIRETKFRKSRLVPLEPTVAEAMRAYARFRDSIVPNPPSMAFLLGENRRALASRTVHWTFRRLCSAAGIPRSSEKRNPRLYDFRHTFACKRLVKWHEESIDVGHAISALSTYLGHAKVTDTYWYLSGIPELFTVTGTKFEAYARKGEKA